MPMKPKPNKHDRRSYQSNHAGNAWRELDKAQEQTKQMPGVLPTQYPNGDRSKLHSIPQ